MNPIYVLVLIFTTPIGGPVTGVVPSTGQVFASKEACEAAKASSIAYQQGKLAGTPDNKFEVWNAYCLNPAQ